MTGKKWFLLLVIITVCSLPYYIYSENLKISVSKADLSKIAWVSIPNGVFAKAADAASYFNKNTKQATSILKQLPEGITVRYLQTPSGAWRGQNFKIERGTAIGVVLAGDVFDAAGLDFKAGDSKEITLKNTGKGSVYAVSLPYGKYAKLSDIIASLEKDSDNPEYIQKVAVWLTAKNKLTTMIYSGSKKKWIGNDSALGRFDAVFITLKDGGKDLNWKP